jgi:hypothetical protein
MPLGRYFVYVGGLLLALILLTDWYLPRQAAEAGRADVDRSTIRIHSVHKWPSAVVFDTTQPTIVPPQPVLAEAAPKPPPTEKSPREALALAREADAAAAPPAPAKHVKRRARVTRAPAERVASYETFGFRPFFQPGW